MGFNILKKFTKAKADEVNENFAFIAGNRLIAVNPNTGVPILDFNLGDLTAIGTGSLVGDILGRSGKSIIVHNSSGAVIGTVSFDDLLTLVQATETARGTAELATQAESDGEVDDERIVTAKKRGVTIRIGFSVTLGSNGQITLPTWLGGIIFQWGTGIAGSGYKTSNFNRVFPTLVAFIHVMNKNPVGVDGNFFRSFNIDYLSTSQFRYEAISVASTDVRWFAIGL